MKRLAGQLPSAERDFADNLVPPPDEQAQGQLLRAMASTAIRGALELLLNYMIDGPGGYVAGVSVYQQSRGYAAD